MNLIGRLLSVLLACLVVFICSRALAEAAAANTLHELYAKLDSCLSASKISGAVGSELTIVFSLRRDGGLLGRPRISFSRLSGDVEQQRAFAQTIAAAFDRCLPIPITDALGGAIAGRPMSMRFIVRQHETGT